MKITIDVDTQCSVFYYAQALYEANDHFNGTFEEYLADWVSEVAFHSDRECDEAAAYICEYKQEIVAKHPEILKDLDYMFDD